MYGTREMLCRVLNTQYPADTPLMLVVWSPADIEALAEGMEYSLTDPEIRTVLAYMDEIPEEKQTESGITAGVAMEIISQVKAVVQNVPVPAELLESLIVIAEQALWKREWVARDNNTAVPEFVTRRLAMVSEARALLKNNTTGNN